MCANAKILASIVAAILFVTVAGYAVTSGSLLGGTVPNPEFQSSYNKSQETVHITLTEGNFRKDGLEPERIQILSSYNGPSKKTDSTPVKKISNSSASLNSSLWYSADAGGLNPSVPEKGDSVTILADGTDRDGDGIHGIEEDEEFRLRVYFQNGDDAVYIGAKIEDGQIQND